MCIQTPIEAKMYIANRSLNLRNSTGCGLYTQMYTHCLNKFNETVSAGTQRLVSTHQSHAQSSPWELPLRRGGGLFLTKNTLFCVILTTFLSHWAKLCITDSLLHTTCVETNEAPWFKMSSNWNQIIFHIRVDTVSSIFSPKLITQIPSPSPLRLIFLHIIKN